MQARELLSSQTRLPVVDAWKLNTDETVTC